MHYFAQELGANTPPSVPPTSPPLFGTLAPPTAAATLSDGTISAKRIARDEAARLRAWVDQQRARGL